MTASFEADVVWGCDMMRMIQLTLVCVMVLVSAAGQLQAAPILLEPTDLHPGDQYRLVFVTSTTTTPLSSDISTYNSFVDALGDTVKPGDWRVIGSTDTVDARDNTSTNPGTDGTGVPIYRLDDTRIANDYVHLWTNSTILAPLEITEEGNVKVTNVWTGTLQNGVASSNAHLGNLGGVIYGESNNPGTWVEEAGDSSINAYSLYGLSEVLTISGATNPVPEPNSLAMWGIGAIGLIVFHRRKRKQAA